MAPDVIPKKESPKENEALMQRSLLSIAARSGFYEGIKMLVEKGAKLENGSEHPILTALQRGSRECFVALIDGREEIVLNNYQDHSLAYHAIQYDTTLLPLLASVMQKEYQKLLDRSSQTNVTFPPSDLSNKDKKKFETALKYDDLYLPYELVRKSARQYLCPWHILTDKPIENMIQSDDDDNNENNDINNNQYEYEASTAATSRNNKQISPSPSINSVNNNYSSKNVREYDDHNGYSSSVYSKERKSAKTNSYSNKNRLVSPSVSYSEDEEPSSDHYVFSALDDEDDVLKTNSDPFKGKSPEWIPLSQRNQKNQYQGRNQSSSHKTQNAENSSHGGYSRKKTTNNYEYELSEGTYEQSGNDYTTNNYTYATYADGGNDDDSYYYSEEEEEEEDIFDNR